MKTRHPSLHRLLLIEYVAATAADHDIKNAIARKEKKKLPLPLCCWRYRPSKAYFMYTLKWSVLQFVIIDPCEFVSVHPGSVHRS